MSGLEPQQLDSAVRLVLTGSNGPLVRSSWSDLWDNTLRVVLSADTEDLWQSLCRISANARRPPDRTDTEAAHTRADTYTEPPPREPDPLATRPAKPMAVPEGQALDLIRCAAYSLLALASLLAGFGVITLLAPRNSMLLSIQHEARRLPLVQLLTVVASAVFVWICGGWVLSWGYLATMRLRSGEVIRQSMPYAAAVAIAGAGVAMLVVVPSPSLSLAKQTSSSPPPTVAALRKVLPAPPGVAPAANANLAPPGLRGLPATAGTWALPLAASIIVQGAGLIRPATQPPSAAQPAVLASLSQLATTTTSTTVTPTPATAAATPAAVSALLANAGVSAAVPSPLPLAGARATATPAPAAIATDPVVVTTSTSVRATLPGARAIIEAAPAPMQASGPTAEALTALAAAPSPTAPAAHLRFGPPPPSPR